MVDIEGTEKKQEQESIRVNFADQQVAAMIIAYCSSLGISVQQFGKVMRVFTENPNAIADAFESLYGHYARFINDNKTEPEQSVLILPPHVEAERNANAKRKSDSDGGTESRSEQPTPAPVDKQRETGS